MHTNIGRSNRNKTIMTSIAIAGVVLMTGTVHAAWQTIDNSRTATQDESTYGCTLNMYAQDGDVVTTNKWNCAMAKIKLLANVIYDWPQVRTPTIEFGNDGGGASNGIYTSGLNL